MPLPSSGGAYCRAVDIVPVDGTITLGCIRDIRQYGEFTLVERLVKPTDDVWVTAVVLAKKNGRLGSCGKLKRGVRRTVFVVDTALTQIVIVEPCLYSDLLQESVAEGNDRIQLVWNPPRPPNVLRDRPTAARLRGCTGWPRRRSRGQTILIPGGSWNVLLMPCTPSLVNGETNCQLPG